MSKHTKAKGGLTMPTQELLEIILMQAQQIVDDYDNYGEVLQAGSDGWKDSTIEALKVSLDSWNATILERK